MANANRNLLAILRAEGLQTGVKSWTWASLMARALYDDEVGYYRLKDSAIGKKGDFYTSVSVGNVYGQLLAAYIFHRWKESGSPRPFHLIEQGAHHGMLAKDVLQALALCDPSLPQDLHYWMIEPSEGFRERQRETLKDISLGGLHHLSSWLDWTAGDAFAFSNELVDAFPVHRVQFHRGEWKECYVTLDESGELHWELGPMSEPALHEACLPLGTDLPEDYQTEIHLAAQTWMKEICQSSFSGEMLIFDYGYTEAEYYLPERSQGTLRRYFQHQSDRNVLENLGDCDLTAHINFTALARVAEEGGFQVLEFMEQGRFLSHVATQHVLKPSDPPDQAWVRQFMTLTHPAHLGHNFRVLSVSRSLDTSRAPVDRAMLARERLGLINEA